VGKATRNRQAKRAGKPGKLVFPGFPYEREFSEAELAILFPRWERIKETLRDAIGPQGWGLGMSEDFLQQIALHQALAGVDVDPAYPPIDEGTGRGAFIRPVRNIGGLFVDSIKWVLTKKDAPGDRAADNKREAEARLKALKARAMQDADPDVREAMRELMHEGAEWANDQLTLADDDEPAAKLGREEPDT
jgi:hypothetical protein